MNVPVQIIDPAHPHANEFGVMDTEDHPSAVSLGGMCMVELENCPHGNDGCYAYKKQCRKSTEEIES
jgi:hypothetical protein